MARSEKEVRMRADTRPDVFDTGTLSWVRVFHLARESPAISTSPWIPVNVMNASGYHASREDEKLSPRCSKSWALLVKSYSKQHHIWPAQNSLHCTSPRCTVISARQHSHTAA